MKFLVQAKMRCHIGYLVAAFGAMLAVSSVGCGSSDSSVEEDPCKPEDADGIIGGNKTFEVTATDAEFDPKVLTAQNRANVTLTLINDASTAQGFSIDCLPTPNSDGCPTESCFPLASTAAPVPPGERVTVQFEVPVVEGIYTFRSGADGDTKIGQFVVQ